MSKKKRPLSGICSVFLCIYMYIYIHTTGYLMMFSVIQSCYHSHSLLWTTKINFKYHKWPQCQNLETLVLFFSGRKKKVKDFFNFFVSMTVGRTRLGGYPEGSQWRESQPSEHLTMNRRI